MRRAGSAPSSSGVGPSARKRHQAAARDHRRVVGAQRAGSGGRPAGRRAARRRATLGAQRRVGGDPAADDDGLDAGALARPASSLATSTSTTASWNDAATSATADVGVLAHVVHHRGLQAREREVVGLVEHRPRERRSRRGRLRSRAGRSPGRPGSRGRGTGRPCRTPRRRRRRWSGRARGTPVTSIATSIVCPPDTSSMTSGSSSVGLLEQRRVQVGLEVVDADERHARSRARAPWPRSRRRAARPPARDRAPRRPRRCRASVDAGLDQRLAR